MANPNPKTEHLKKTQWKKGESGNPKGRGAVPSFKTVIRQMLEDEITIEQAGKLKKITKQQAMVLKQIEKAIQSSDTTAFNAIIDRVEGRPEQKNVIEGGENPVGIVDLTEFNRGLKQKTDEELQEEAAGKNNVEEEG